jgi:hypothetical protein
MLETGPLHIPVERTISCWRRLRDLYASLQRRAVGCLIGPEMPDIYQFKKRFVSIVTGKFEKSFG